MSTEPRILITVPDDPDAESNTEDVLFAIRSILTARAEETE